MDILGQILLSGPTPSRSCFLSRTSWTTVLNGLLHGSEDWPPTYVAPLHTTYLDKASCVDIDIWLSSLPYRRDTARSIYLRTSQTPSLPSPVASRLSSLCFTTVSDWSCQIGYALHSASRYSDFARYPLRAPSSVSLIVRLVMLDDRTRSDETPAVPLVTALGRNGLVRCDGKRLNNPMAQSLDATRDTSPPRERNVRRQLRRRRCHVKSARPNNLRLYQNPRGRAISGFVWATGPLETVGRIDRRHRSCHSDLGVLRNRTSERPLRSHRPLCVH
jgi:hypothetical protein